jgi:hypothetical protein
MGVIMTIEIEINLDLLLSQLSSIDFTDKKILFQLKKNSVCRGLSLSKKTRAHLYAKE